MNEILYRAAAYLLIIALGVFLKKVGFFHEQDFKALAKILLNITLPCAIIYSFSQVEFQVSLLTVTGLSLFVGIFIILIAYFTSRMSGTKENIPFDILNLSGYNIGNFCLPFAQSFLEPLSLLGITLFDMGNAFYCNGGAKAVAEVFKNSIYKTPGTEIDTKTQLKNSLKTIGRALSRSTPFLVYFAMLIILVLGIPIPKIVLSVTQIGSNANAFTAMLMIGVGFKLNIKKDGISHVIRILITRYAVTISFAAIAFFLLPFPLQIRQALVLAFLSPIASACPAYTDALGEDYELSSTINSISMLISIVLITCALLVML